MELMVDISRISLCLDGYEKGQWKLSFLVSINVAMMRFCSFHAVPQIGHKSEED